LHEEKMQKRSQIKLGESGESPRAPPLRIEKKRAPPKSKEKKEAPPALFFFPGRSEQKRKREGKRRAYNFLSGRRKKERERAYYNFYYEEESGSA